MLARLLFLLWVDIWQSLSWTQKDGTQRRQHLNCLKILLTRMQGIGNVIELRDSLRPPVLLDGASIEVVEVEAEATIAL